jgi:NADPH-dependent curcumin reductase CurA
MVRHIAAAMEHAVNRQWRIARRPEGLAKVTDFEWTESPVPRPGPDQALVRNKLLSLDPTNRSWMSERDTYLPPLKLGEVMRGICVATVVESNNQTFRVGMPLYGVFGWQDYAIVGPEDLVAPLPEDPEIPLTIHLGLFGHVGMTAYFGLVDVAKPKPGETLVVSGAAGAVGSLAGQLGKIWGCRVVGIAGTREKCQWLTKELGFDAAVNYREEPQLVEALAQHCPHGIDVYFDNVGGEPLEAALDLINVGARLVLYGMISVYNESGRDGHAPAGPRNLLQVIFKRARMQGFLVLDYWNRASEAIEALAGLHQSGRLKYRVHVIEGLENAPTAMNMLFDGSNQGKLVVRI